MEGAVMVQKSDDKVYQYWHWAEEELLFFADSIGEYLFDCAKKREERK